MSKGWKRRYEEQKAKSRWVIIEHDLFDWEANPLVVTPPLSFDEVALKKENLKAKSGRMCRYTIEKANGTLPSRWTSAITRFET